jgi:tetratricopeptide (TPR) repeat protein
VIKLVPATVFLIAGVMAASAFAAGGTTTTVTPSPSLTTATPKKPSAIIAKAKPVAVAKKVAPAADAIVDAWAVKFGELGPAYLSAVKLANDAKYDEAIKAFNALNKPDDPRVNNWIGFSLRKQGKVDAAMPYYDKALKTAPDFTPAYEYLGEAYLQMKNLAKAQDQLAMIEKLCGNKTCEEYKDLSAAMATAAL